MTPAFKRFLAEDGGRLAQVPGRFLALGAFGKHPGWDDHIEDLGLETESLALARKVLYVEGVGGQIDKGAWEKLPPAQRLEDFDHTFVWHRSGQFLIGRMWSSSDGKGRTRYPMVVCAHYSGATLNWGLERVLPKLVEVEQACRAVETAAEVRAILDRAREALRGTLANTGPNAQSVAPAAEALRAFMRDPAFGPDQQGWQRIIYHIQNRMAAFAPGKFDAKDAAAWAQPVRVPAGAGLVDQSLPLWNEFFATRIDRMAPTLFISPARQPWLDVIVGEPSSPDFFCLRAQPVALPMVTDVPYEMDGPFKARARQIMADFERADGLDTTTPAAVGETPSGGWSSFTQRWFKGKGTH
jgi:hypothetical protein